MLLGKTKKEYYAVADQKWNVSIAFRFCFSLTLTKSGKDHTGMLASQLDITIIMLENMLLGLQSCLLSGTSTVVKKSGTGHARILQTFPLH